VGFGPTGEVELERLKVTVKTGRLVTRTSRGYHSEKRTKPLLLLSEIRGLAPMRAFVKVDNLLARSDFPYIEPRKK